MSGVEIVGLLLGGFPLLISAAEHYKEGFEPLVKWKRFRKDFIAFIDAVDIEKQLFYQMLERFLISADVPHEELRLFMTDPEYVGWHGEELVNILKGRLGSSYDAYMSTLKTMSQLMADLQELLCLKNGKVEWADEGASRWDYQLKRIRLSFSKRGVRTLESLENHNRKLRELLDSSDKLESLKVTRNDTSWGNVFESIRKHATSLHTAVKRSWNCNCSTPHQGDLQLQCRKTGDWSSTFHMAFDVPEMTTSSIICRREVAITVRKKDQEPLPARTPSPSFSVESSKTYTDHLRRNFEHKSSSQLSLASRPMLTPSVSGSSVTSSQSSFMDVFSRSNSGQSANTSISCMSGTEVLLTESSTRKWLPKSLKPKKSVRMQVPCPNSQLELAINVQSDAMINSSISLGSQLSVATISDVVSAAIDDLCSQIRHAVKDNGLGHLTDEQQHFYELTCLKQDNIMSQEDSFITLDAMLRHQGSLGLSRRQRYNIACILASSVLQLQSTPWLLEKLDKKNILFYKKGPEVALEQPYVRHTFHSNKLTSPISTAASMPQAPRFAARNSLSNLGIVLLELCFGQVIEAQEFRKFYLGPDGTPHDATDYMTARDWAEMVSEEDPALEHIIKCCVFCIFEEKADWGSKKFTQAVYCSVVEPLEKINSRWTAS